MMRIGRAAAAGTRSRAATTNGSARPTRCVSAHASRNASVALSIYPWDIVTEMERRLESPQAMLLVVPNGKVKLLNALPFAPADLRRDSLEQAWDAYRAAWRVARRCANSCPRVAPIPALLRHANETWPVPGLETTAHAPAHS